MKHVLLLLLACFSAIILDAQSTPPWLWADYITGNLGAYINDAKTDPQGNTYYIGTDDYSNTSYIYLGKKNSSGIGVWGASVAGTNQCLGGSIAVDTAGNVFIAGKFDGTGAAIYTSTGSVNMTASGLGGIFIAKLSAAGQVLWAHTIAYTTNYYGSHLGGLSTDIAGNLYLTGTFGGSLTFGTTTISTTAPLACCFAKLDPNGNTLWAHSLSATGSNVAEGEGTAVDAAGNVYLQGNFQGGTLTIGTSTFTNHGLADIFLAKYSPGGGNIWARSMGGSDMDFAEDMAIDKNNNILLTGSIVDTVAFGSHTIYSTSHGCMFTAKYDSSGSNLWAVGTATNSYEEGNAVSADTAGNIYVAGNFESKTIIFGHDTLVNLDTTGTNDVFITKYDPSGNIQWGKHLGAKMQDAAVSIGNDLSGNIYLAGGFGGTNIIFGDTQLVNTGPYPTTVQAAFLSKLAYYICSYALPYDSLTVPATGGRDTVPVITQTGCDWSASVISGSSWIFVTASGRAGSSLYVTTSSNTADTTRMGIVMVDSIPLVIVQPGNPATCTYTATPDTFYTVGPDAATYSDIAVVTTQKGCVWSGTVTIGSSWLTTTSTGITGDSVDVTVTANPSIFPRTAEINIGFNANIYVVQAANPNGITSVPDNDMTVYPNPATGMFYVKGATVGNSIQVYDMLGQCVYIGIISGAVQAVTLGKEATGIYTYRISDNNNSIRQGKITMQ